MPKNVPPSVPKKTRPSTAAGVVPVGPSIGTADTSAPVTASITWSLPSQPAMNTRPSAMVGEQRIWSAMECFQRSAPSARCRQASDASCEPTNTRGSSLSLSAATIVGPPEISPSVSYSHSTVPVERSNARTTPVSSPTTTSGTRSSSDTAAADGNPAASALNDQRVAPVSRSSAWNVPSRSPT